VELADGLGVDPAEVDAVGVAAGFSDFGDDVVVGAVTGSSLGSVGGGVGDDVSDDSVSLVGVAESGDSDFLQPVIVMAPRTSATTSMREDVNERIRLNSNEVFRKAEASPCDELIFMVNDPLN